MRKNCLECGTKLRMDILGKGRGYNANGFFCTLRCGFRYGVRMAKGYSA